MTRTCTHHGIYITDEPGDDCPVCLAEYEQPGESDGVSSAVVCIPAHRVLRSTEERPVRSWCDATTQK